MSTPITENTDKLQEILEQVSNLPDRSSTTENCVVKTDIASDDDALGFAIEMGFVNPASNGDNIIYTDNNNSIYIL